MTNKIQFSNGETLMIKIRLAKLDDNNRAIGYEYRQYLNTQNTNGFPPNDLLGKSVLDLMFYYFVIGIYW